MSYDITCDNGAHLRIKNSSISRFQKYGANYTNQWTNNAERKPDKHIVILITVALPRNRFILRNFRHFSSTLLYRVRPMRWIPSNRMPSQRAELVTPFRAKPARRLPHSKAYCNCPVRALARARRCKTKKTPTRRTGLPSNRRKETKGDEFRADAPRAKRQRARQLSRKMVRR